jgi:hypothetical protein
MTIQGGEPPSLKMLTAVIPANAGIHFPRDDETFQMLWQRADMDSSLRWNDDSSR